MKVEKKESQQPPQKIVVFDMDGTLYQLDGENNSYQGSSLQQKVENNAKSLIMELNMCSEQEASEILQEIHKSEVYLSLYFKEKYEISREEYFDLVWDINPEGIVHNYISEQEFKKAFVKENHTLILLTAAPKVWQKRVLNHLGIDTYFQHIFTGEMYINKTEIFSQLISQFPDTKITSIGDQLHTDIEPALELGMDAIHVNSPEALTQISL